MGHNRIRAFRQVESYQLLVILNNLISNGYVCSASGGKIYRRHALRKLTNAHLRFVQVKICTS